MSGLKFKAHSCRYVVDVFRGHSTTLVRGDDWAKFKRDFNLGQDQVVVFDMSGRMTQAYVCYIGSDLAADHGTPEHDMDGGDVVGEGGAAAFAVVGEEDAINTGHGLGAAPNIIYTKGVVLNDAEGQMLGLILTIKDGYIGPYFVHRLISTNITSKLMKIPKKIVQPLNLCPEGVIVLCMGARDVMQVPYHTDCDGRMVFNKEWGVFVAQNHLHVDDALVFNFKKSNSEDMNITCVIHTLRKKHKSFY